MMFAEITMLQVIELMNVEVGDVVISGESIKEVERILDLDGKSVDELRAVRNTVVKTVNEEILTPLEEKCEWGKMREYMTKLSGITGAIDQNIWTQGGAV